MYSGTCRLLSFMWHWQYITFGKQNCLRFSYFRGVYFLGKEIQEPFFFIPNIVKILHLKAKRNFTLLVASSSDFFSAIVILNQNLDTRKVVWGKVCILKRFNRLRVVFYVQDRFLCESLSFENYCIKESCFVLSYFGLLSGQEVRYVDFCKCVENGYSRRTGSLWKPFSRHVINAFFPDVIFFNDIIDLSSCVVFAIDASRSLKCSLFSSCTSASCILSDLFMMTIVVPLSALKGLWQSRF